MLKPRVLLVLTEFPPTFGGMQTHAVYLCRHLEEQGYPIAVATYRHEDSAATDAGFDFPVHRILSRIGYWENIRQLDRLANSFDPDLAYSSTVFYGHLAQRLRIPMLCRSAGNDVLRPWITWPYRPLSATLSQAWFEDFAYDKFRRLEWPESLEGMLLDRRRHVMTESAGAMTRVLANSRFTAALLREIGVQADRVRILPGGVDARRFFPAFTNQSRLRLELGIPPQAYVILTACRLVAKKGIDLLIAAMPELRRRMPDAHLVVVGDGRDRAKCERLASEAGMAGAVSFAGYVEHDKLHDYYWCADQFVLPSRQTVHGFGRLRDVETMGRVLCEANAAGVPVVTSRSGGIPTIVRDGENGLLFEEGAGGEMVEAILRVREDAALSRQLVENGLRLAAEAFDWRVICEAHEREFASAMKPAGAALEPVFATAAL